MDLSSDRPRSKKMADIFVGIGESSLDGPRQHLRRGTPGLLECGGLPPLYARRIVLFPKAEASFRTPNWPYAFAAFLGMMELFPQRVQEPEKAVWSVFGGTPNTAHQTHARPGIAVARSE
jgi:hypothetical protein